MNEVSTRPGTVYFHGLPGSARELELMSNPNACRPEVWAPLALSAPGDSADHGTPVRVIGFSLGAFSALKLAAARPDKVSELILISPAAPLELGPFLDQMAGAPVFKAARASRTGFALLTALQAVAAHVAPRFLLQQMFANSCAAEQALLQDPQAVDCLTDGLKHALWQAAPAYRQTVRSYVSPWEAEVSRVACPCQIYHGKLDDWVPLGMAEALAAHMAQESQLHALDGLGHYSTLIKVLPDLL